MSIDHLRPHKKHKTYIKENFHIQYFVSLYVLLNRKQLLTNTEWRGSLEYLAEIETECHVLLISFVIESTLTIDSVESRRTRSFLAHQKSKFEPDLGLTLGPFDGLGGVFILADKSLKVSVVEMPESELVVRRQVSQSSFVRFVIRLFWVGVGEFISLS